MMMKQNQLAERIQFVTSAKDEEEEKILENVASKIVDAFGAEFFSGSSLDLIVDKLTMDLEIAI